eukprot:UN21367
MSKEKTQYQCNACAAISPKWVGQCPDCGEWNTLEECRMPARRGTSAPRASAGYAGDNAITTLSQVSAASLARSSSGISELDRVLGGGLVGGSVTLLGGDPGIGKSTLPP